MYSTSLTHLGNLSGYYNDKNSTYGAEFNEVKALTPYYERAIHYIDHKPWKHQYFDTTYLNYYKRRNEDPVITYKELEFKPISANNYESVEGFNNISKCNNGCNNNYSNFNDGRANNTNVTINKNFNKNENSNKNNTNNIESTFNKTIDENNHMKNYHAKLLLTIFLLLVIYLIINH